MVRRQRGYLRRHKIGNLRRGAAVGTRCGNPSRLVNRRQKSRTKVAHSAMPQSRIDRYK